jgi:hypothetical protein
VDREQLSNAIKQYGWQMRSVGVAAAKDKYSQAMDEAKVAQIMREKIIYTMFPPEQSWTYDDVPQPFKEFHDALNRP